MSSIRKYLARHAVRKAVSQAIKQSDPRDQAQEPAWARRDSWQGRAGEINHGLKRVRQRATSSDKQPSSSHVDRIKRERAKPSLKKLATFIQTDAQTLPRPLDSQRSRTIDQDLATCEIRADGVAAFVKKEDYVHAQHKKEKVYRQIRCCHIIARK